MGNKDYEKREMSKEKETIKTLRSDLRKLQKELKKYRDDAEFSKIFRRLEKLEEENLTLKKRLKNLGKVMAKSGKSEKQIEKIETATDKCECGGKFDLRKWGNYDVRVCDKCKKRERL